MTWTTSFTQELLQDKTIVTNTPEYCHLTSLYQYFKLNKISYKDHDEDNGFCII